jgi:alkyl sulfatase BDS1-like metallo-beta-lactamase superfamily hydrolase
MGAYELRNGVLSRSTVGSPDSILAMTIPMIFDYFGVRLNGSSAAGRRIVINWNFTDVDEQYVLNLENSALTYMSSPPVTLPTDADVTFTLGRATLNAILVGAMSLEQAIGSGAVQVQGNPAKLGELLSLLDTFGEPFNIVTP